MKKIVYLFIIALIPFSQFSCSSSSEGEEYFKNGEYAKAIEVFTADLQTKPRNAEILYNRGRAYEELGKLDSALLDYKQVIDNNPSHANALISAANVYLKKSDNDNALYYSQMAIDNTDGNAMAYFMQGRAHHNKGMFNEALADYDNAIRLDKNLGRAFLFRGAVKIALKRTKDGCGDLRIAKSLNIAEADAALQKYCGK